MTYAQAISRISNSLNSLQKDARIPKRYILSVLKETAEFLLSQKLRDRTLFRETDLFKWIRCVELKQEDTVKCPILEFKKCKTLSRSKHKLPKIVGSKYGYAVLVVQTVDGEKHFKHITLREYNNNSKRENAEKFKGGYFYINEYLYIPDSEIELVDILLLTLDEDAEDCSSCSDRTECDDVLQQEFPVPSKLMNVVIQETLKELSFRLQIPRDENSDLDSHQKSATIQ